MAWDASRPVPWRQLIRSWLVYVAIMAVLFLVFFRDRPLIGIFAGLFVSGPLYVGFGYVLAKFGYQRKTWSELREERTADDRGSSRTSSAEPGPRPKPAPTRRTSGGGDGRSGRPTSGKRRRR